MEFSETEIKALAQGDTKVFHKLYEHFFVALCIFARSFSLKPEEAEDIVQEVFCRMYDEHRLFEGLNTLKSYLYTAVRNRSFNYLRDEKRRSIREAQFLNNLKAEEEGYNSALKMKSIANSNYYWKNYLNSARISFNVPYREILLKKSLLI